MRKAKQVAVALGLNPDETEYFYTLIQERYVRSEKSMNQIRSKLRSQEMVGTDFSLEYFKTISDWHYFAIIELTGVKDFQSDPNWIATRLGISSDTVQDSLARLIKLELLERDGRGNLKKTYGFRATPSGIPNRAIKAHHQQILRKAETTLFEKNLQETDFSSITFSMKIEDLAWAKDEIKKFRRKLTKKLAEHPACERIYELSIQLFPLDQMELTETKPKKGER